MMRGYNSDKLVLMMYANRKNIEIFKNGILELEPHALIGESDVVTIDGGTVPKRTKLVK